MNRQTISSFSNDRGGLTDYEEVLSSLRSDTEKSRARAARVTYLNGLRRTAAQTRKIDVVDEDRRVLTSAYRLVRYTKQSADVNVICKANLTTAASFRDWRRSAATKSIGFPIATVIKVTVKEARTVNTSLIDELLEHNTVLTNRAGGRLDCEVPTSFAVGDCLEAEHLYSRGVHIVGSREVLSASLLSGWRCHVSRDADPVCAAGVYIAESTKAVDIVERDTLAIMSRVALGGIFAIILDEDTLSLLTKFSNVTTALGGVSSIATDFKQMSVRSHWKVLGYSTAPDPSGSVTRFMFVFRREPVMTPAVQLAYDNDTADGGETGPCLELKKLVTYKPQTPMGVQDRTTLLSGTRAPIGNVVYSGVRAYSYMTKEVHSAYMRDVYYASGTHTGRLLTIYCTPERMVKTLYGEKNQLAANLCRLKRLYVIVFVLELESPRSQRIWPKVVQGLQIASVLEHGEYYFLDLSKLLKPQQLGKGLRPLIAYLRAPPRTRGNSRDPGLAMALYRHLWALAGKDRTGLISIPVSPRIPKMCDQPSQFGKLLSAATGNHIFVDRPSDYVWEPVMPGPQPMFAPSFKDESSLTVFTLRFQGVVGNLPSLAARDPKGNSINPQLEWFKLQGAGEAEYLVDINCPNHEPVVIRPSVNRYFDDGYKGVVDVVQSDTMWVLSFRSSSGFIGEPFGGFHPGYRFFGRRLLLADEQPSLGLLGRAPVPMGWVAQDDYCNVVHQLIGDSVTTVSVLRHALHENMKSVGACLTRAVAVELVASANQYAKQQALHGKVAEKLLEMSIIGLIHIGSISNGEFSNLQSGKIADLKKKNLGAMKDCGVKPIALVQLNDTAVNIALGVARVSHERTRLAISLEGASKGRIMSAVPVNRPAPVFKDEVARGAVGEMLADASSFTYFATRAAYAVAKQVVVKAYTTVGPVLIGMGASSAGTLASAPVQAAAMRYVGLEGPIMALLLCIGLFSQLAIGTAFAYRVLQRLAEMGSHTGRHYRIPATEGVIGTCIIHEEHMPKLVEDGVESFAENYDPATALLIPEPLPDVTLETAGFYPLASNKTTTSCAEEVDPGGTRKWREKIDLYDPVTNPGGHEVLGGEFPSLPIFCPRGPTFGAMLLGLTIFVFYVARSCFCNARHAMVKRHLKKRVVTQETPVRGVTFMMSALPAIVREYKERIGPMLLDFDNRWSQAKRMATTFSIVRDAIKASWVKLMIKREIVFKFEKPRGIQFYLNRATQRLFAAQTAAFQDACSAVFKGYTVAGSGVRLWFGSKFNNDDLGEWMHEAIDAGYTLAYESDARAWDASLTVIMFQLCAIPMLMACCPAAAAFAAAGLIVTCVYECGAKGLFKFLLKIRGTTKSGHNTTTIFNNIINAMIHVHILLFLGLSGWVIVHGDDLLIMLLPEAGKLTHKIEEVGRRLGIDPVAACFTGWENVSFISGLWYPGKKGKLVFAPKLGRILARMSWTTKNVPEKFRDGYMAVKLDGLAVQLGGIKLFDAFYTAMYPAKEHLLCPEHFYRDEMMYGVMSRSTGKRNAFAVDIDDFICKRYGIDRVDYESACQMTLDNRGKIGVVRHPVFDALLGYDLADPTARGEPFTWVGVGFR